MKREDVVHICNGILLGHEKGWNSATRRDVASSKDCQGEVSQKEIMSRFLNDRDLTSFFMVTVPATYQVLKVLSYKGCEKMWQSEN